MPTCRLRSGVLARDEDGWMDVVSEGCGYRIASYYERLTGCVYLPLALRVY